MRNAAVVLSVLLGSMFSALHSSNVSAALPGHFLDSDAIASGTIPPGGATTSSEGPNGESEGPSVGKTSGRTYACSVLNFFANSRIERVDLAEVALWLDFLIDGDPVTTDEGLLEQLRDIRELPLNGGGGVLRNRTTRAALIQTATEACGPCNPGAQIAQFQFNSCWIDLYGDTTPEVVGESSPGGNGSESSPTTKPETSVASPDESSSFSQAEAALKQQLSARLGNIDPNVFSACGRIFAVAPLEGRVDFYKYSSNRWTLSHQEDFPGKPISISLTRSLSDPSPDFVLRFRNSFDGEVNEALLFDLGTCDWEFAKFQLTTVGFPVASLKSLNITGDNVVGANQFRSGIRFFFDSAQRMFVEQS